MIDCFPLTRWLDKYSSICCCSILSVPLWPASQTVCPPLVELTLLLAHSINYKVRGRLRGSAAHRNDMANTPLCGHVRGGARGVWRAAACLPFCSAVCDHVSVWWFSSLGRSVSWNDYAEGPRVNTMTHLLCSTSPSPSPAPLSFSLFLPLVFTHARRDLSPSLTAVS